MVDIYPIQDEAEWLERRRSNVGGSEVAALFNCQPDYAMSHFTLWQVKAGRMKEPKVDAERAEWGKRLEAAIADAAAHKAGWTIADAGYVPHETVEGLACTLDYLIVAGEAGREDPGHLEIKNTDWMMHKYQWTEGEPPLHILLQLQHQLACTGYQWGAVAALVGGNRLEIYRYEARPKVIREIETRVRLFWQAVEHGDEPTIDGTFSSAAAVKELYPDLDIDAEALDLTDDDEAARLCALYLEAGGKRREAEKAERLAKSNLVAKLGQAPNAYCNGYTMKCTLVRDTAGKPITADMVGEFVGGRKGHKRITVKEAEEATP